jgi:hypothetical protein
MSPNCNNLDAHLRHELGNKNIAEFLARDMRKDTMKYIGPKDDQEYPDILRSSKDLLAEKNWAAKFARQQNDLYLGCKYPPRLVTETEESASSSQITSPPLVQVVTITSVLDANGSGEVPRNVRRSNDRYNSSRSLFQRAMRFARNTSTTPL